MITFEVESKSIWTFGFSTLYTVLPRFDLISALKKIVDFALKWGNKSYINFSERRLFGVINLNSYISLQKIVCRG